MDGLVCRGKIKKTGPRTKDEEKKSSVYEKKRKKIFGSKKKKAGWSRRKEGRGKLPRNTIPRKEKRKRVVFRKGKWRSELKKKNETIPPQDHLLRGGERTPSSFMGKEKKEGPPPVEQGGEEAERTFVRKKSGPQITEECHRPLSKKREKKNQHARTSGGEKRTRATCYWGKEKSL